MALGDSYATPAELGQHASFRDSQNDDEATRVLSAISRNVEHYCRRQFNDAGAATARQYSPLQSGWVRVDDFHTIVGLVVQTGTGEAGVYDTTIGSTEYVLYPRNGVMAGRPGWPFDEIRVRSSLVRLPWWRDWPTVQVTARWGWAAVPDDVKTAVLIKAARVFSRKYSPNGLVGQGEFVFRITRQSDPDVAEMLDPYRLEPLVG